MKIIIIVSLLQDFMRGLIWCVAFVLLVTASNAVPFISSVSPTAFPGSSLHPLPILCLSFLSTIPLPILFIPNSHC
jgi:hypothetical protein